MQLSKIAIYFMLAPIMLLTSCATIMQGTKQSIGISSNPANAGIWIDNCFYGQTPMIVKLTRKDNHFLRLELDGFLPFEATFTRQVSGWVFGNIVFGGICGVAVDAISGGLYRLTPEQIQAQLHQNNMTCKTNGNQSYVAVVLEVDPSWEKIGQLAKAE